MSGTRITSTLLTAAAGLLFSTTAWAVPTLGVGSDGTYYGACDGTYLTAFGATCVDPGTEDPHGFAVESGDTVYLWITGNGGFDPDWLTSDLHLLTDQDDLTNVAFTTGDGTYNINNLLAAPNTAGYYLPYLDGNLGPVTGGDSGWTDMSGSLTGFSGTTWVLEGTITYDGTLMSDHHFFTFLDMNGNGNFDNGDEKFSMKTTSAVGTSVPEPGTLLLMGAGLLGAAILRRRQG